MRLPPLVLVSAVVVVDQAVKYVARCCGEYIESAGISDGVVAAALLLVILILWMFQASRALYPWLALIVGGGASNLFDRFAHGAVIDLIVIGSLVLNVADISLAIGVAGALWILAFSRQ